MLTKFFETEFKGKKIFAVYEVDKEGKQVADKPIVSFGIKKANGLLKHVDDFVSWCESQGIEGTEKFNK